MRVLMTADAVGGVWQYSLQLASLLSRRNTDVMIATMGPLPSADQVAEASRIPGVALRTSAWDLEWMPDPWRGVDHAGTWLLQLEREFAPDVVHINGYTHAHLPWQAPVLVVAHSCVCSWWKAVHGTTPPAEWNEYVSRVTAGLNAADAVAAPTRAMADALAECYGVERDVAVIPNCRDGESVSTAKERLIFTAGRTWDPAKNIAALDAVADELDWPVVVAGERAQPDGGQVALSRVRSVGRLSSSDLRRWMSRAAIYALPARYEPFGLSVLEAALAGCALVLGDIASLRENWSGVARFVHPERPDELCRALRQLIADPEERTKLASAARHRAERFSPARHVTAYERLYQEMVANGRTAYSARTV